MDTALVALGAGVISSVALFITARTFVAAKNSEKRNSQGVAEISAAFENLTAAADELAIAAASPAQAIREAVEDLRLPLATPVVIRTRPAASLFTDVGRQPNFGAGLTGHSLVSRKPRSYGDVLGDDFGRALEHAAKVGIISISIAEVLKGWADKTPAVVPHTTNETRAVAWEEVVMGTFEYSVSRTPLILGHKATPLWKRAVSEPRGLKGMIS